MKADFHPESEEEIWEAIIKYEREVPGLGADFLAEVERAATMLGTHPEAGQVVRFGKREARRWVLQRFPFVLFYVLQPELYVLAVGHTRRRPGYWLHRL